MQNDTAHQLNVIVALAEGTAGRFAGGSKRFGQKIVERFAFSMPFAEFDGERAKFVIRQGHDIAFDLIDLIDRWLNLFQGFLVKIAENLGKQ
ncbi:MAG: hypothetical protein R2845_06290 [Thermomicrobiales bacterium]